MSGIPRYFSVICARQQATAAADRIHQNLYRGELGQTPKEFVYRLSSDWMQPIFVALCDAHGLIAFRDFGMRRDKAMTIAPPALMRDHFQPKLYAAFQDMHMAIVDLTSHYIANHVSHFPSDDIPQGSNTFFAGTILRNSGGTGLDE